MLIREPPHTFMGEHAQKTPRQKTITVSFHHDVKKVTSARTGKR